VPGQSHDEFLPAGQHTVYLLEYRGDFNECFQAGQTHCQSKPVTLFAGETTEVSFAGLPR
jgi:hypothetical protein